MTNLRLVGAVALGSLILNGCAARLDETEFWSVVEQARQARFAKAMPMARALEDQLAPLSEQEIVDFQRILAFQRERCYHSDLWQAAYILNGGCSDDCFDYFQGWLIGLGKETFDRAVRDPEVLVGYPPYTPEDGYEDESTLYAAQEAYLKKTGHEMADVDMAIPNKEGGAGLFDETKVSQRLPKLWAWVEKQR